MSKIITLVAGWTNCVAGDITKQVKDDGVEIGVLLGYNNTSGEWWVDTTVLVAGNSVMSITDGTGAGTTVAYSGYCTIAQIKERCLVTGAAQDAELESCGMEASRQVDELIRPYLTERQTVTLNESGYVNCSRTDVGKQVLDDEVVVGELLTYNNTTRIWKIETTTTIADASELKIQGTLRGTASGASTDDVTESESPTFIFKTIPLVAIIPTQITHITADFGAAIFLKRYLPDKYQDEWRISATQKLKEFIAQNWKQGIINFV